jgi:uncharacterized membrane protein
MPDITTKNILKRYSTIIISLIIFLGACLRFYQIDRALGGGDENHMLLYFGYTHLQYIATTYFDASNHVFHTMMVNLMSRWFGEENAIAIRLPTFLFGIAGLWMIYKLALEIFISRKIALIALLISAVNPIHIYYSQTARGYSLIMFFSTAIIYSSVKILKPNPSQWHVVSLILCGFLSIYTLPTNIFFMLALAAWLIIIMFVPPFFKNKYGVNKKDKKQRILWFTSSALAIAMLSSYSYLHLFDQIVETARNHSLLTFDTQSASVLNLLPGIIDKIFQGHLKYFFPFLLVGIIYGKLRHKSYRYLPVIIFFLPLAIAAASGAGGFPRNHLFNFPLFTIFLAAGLSVTGERINKWFNSENRRILIMILPVAVYSLTALNVVLFEHYPSTKTLDGNLYKEKVLQNNKSNDLLIINDANNYLYARSVYKTNIQKIIQENRLSGVNFTKEFSNNIKENKVSPERDMWLQLVNMLKKDSNLKYIDVSGGKEITKLSKRTAIPTLPLDFESTAPWQITQGNGKISTIKNHRLSGTQSLKITATPEDSMIAKASIPEEYRVKKTSFIVITLGVKTFNPKMIVYHPLLTASIGKNNKSKRVKLLTRKINDGINIQIKEKTGEKDEYYWKLNAFLGVLPPGSYNFELYLKCHKNNSVLYDGLSMFLIETI